MEKHLERLRDELKKEKEASCLVRRRRLKGEKSGSDPHPDPHPPPPPSPPDTNVSPWEIDDLKRRQNASSPNLVLLSIATVARGESAEKLEMRGVDAALDTKEEEMRSVRGFRDEERERNEMKEP
ncbi:hypothetical protein V8G54_025164 [Vigna mungo]|uniref:Uncharacterized protein n=1 Tax=Vigna mungo TaxID=3915 RepID=A0AAQ3N6Z9_VIGMU